MDDVVGSDGARLTVRVSNDDGPPILLLHAWPGVPASMQTTIAPLLADMRCVRFDQRGVGASTAGTCWVTRGVGCSLRRTPTTTPTISAASSCSARHSASAPTGKRPSAPRSPPTAAEPVCAAPARFITFAAGLALPGKVRTRAVRRLMTETWHNYFLDPASAPDPHRAWLDGCSAEATLATDRAVSRTDRRRLDRLAGLDAPVLVLYGEYDIFGDATHIVRDRFPHARQVTLSGSGHLHWLQQPDAYGDELRGFFRQVEEPSRTGSPSQQRAASLQEQRVAPAAIETADALADSDHAEAARLV